MVAEVSSLSRMVDAYEEEGEGKTELVTLDLLGGCGDGDAATAVAADEVNLELQIRASGDTRLAASSAMLSHQQTTPSPASPHLRDLNLSPPWLSASSPSRKPPPAPPAAAYHSVCTLEKVKSALERESRLQAADGRTPVALPDSASPPSPSRSSSSSAPATTSSSSAKRRPNEPDETDGQQAMAVAACPECLLYVLICKVEPRCPRCAARVPFNGTDNNKKPRIDLNE